MNFIVLRKVIGYPIANILYYLGDFVSKVFNFYSEHLDKTSTDEENSRAVNILLFIYNRLMIGSFVVDKWADLNMWKDVEIKMELTDEQIIESRTAYSSMRTVDNKIYYEFSKDHLIEFVRAILDEQTLMNEKQLSKTGEK